MISPTSLVSFWYFKNHHGWKRYISSPPYFVCIISANLATHVHTSITALNIINTWWCKLIYYITKLYQAMKNWVQNNNSRYYMTYNKITGMPILHKIYFWYTLIIFHVHVYIKIYIMVFNEILNFSFNQHNKIFLG